MLAGTRNIIKSTGRRYLLSDRWCQQAAARPTSSFTISTLG